MKKLTTSANSKRNRTAFHGLGRESSNVGRTTYKIHRQPGGGRVVQLEVASGPLTGKKGTLIQTSSELAYFRDYDDENSEGRRRLNDEPDREETTPDERNDANGESDR